MILNNNDSTLDILGLKKINIEVNHLTFNSLIDRIYNYKLEAVIREVSTNALDVHRDSGITTPFKISLFYNNDTSLITKISIKDYGKGLTAEEMELYLATLNSSSKRDSSDQVGCLGLGAKSPFSITTKFQYVSIKDGIKSTLDFERVENETPRYEIRSEETNEESGTECIIPCSFELDKVIKAIQTQLAVFPIKPEIIQYNSDFTVEDLSNIFFEIDEYETFSIIYTDNYQFDSAVYVQMGPVLYRIPEGTIYSYNRINNQVFVIKADLGEFIFNDGREYIQLSNNDQINKFLSKLKIIYENLNLKQLLEETYNFNLRRDDIPLLKEYARDEDKLKLLSYPYSSIFNLNSNYNTVFSSLTNTTYNTFSVSFFNLKNFYDFIKTVKYSDNTKESYDKLVKFCLSYRGSILTFYPNECSSKSIYVLVTSATKSLDELEKIKTLDGLDKVLIVSRNKLIENHYNYYKEAFDLDYEFKDIELKDFKTLYPDAYGSIKRESKPKSAKPTNSDGAIVTSDGFVSGQKYTINYYFKDEEDLLSVTQTARQLKTTFKNLLKSWFSNIMVFPKELVSTQKDKEFIESIICKNHSLRIYEIDNEVDISTIVDILKSINVKFYNYKFNYNPKVNKYIIDYYQIRDYYDEFDSSSYTLSSTLTKSYYKIIFSSCFDTSIALNESTKEFIDYTILKILGEEGVEEFKTKYSEHIKTLPKELIYGLHRSTNGMELSS